MIQANENFEFNLNYNVRVKLTDAGIEYYVKNVNNDIPFKLHISFKEYKQRADIDGYHTYQMHQFMDNFGGLGMQLAKYVDLFILIPAANLKPLTPNL